MSYQSLAKRQRAQSTVSLRKKIIRGTSEDKNTQLKKSSTTTSFWPKLQRLIQEGKVQQIMNCDASNKANLFYTNHVNDMEKELSVSKKSLSTLVIKSRSKQMSINSLKNQIRKVQHEINVIRQQAAATSQRYAGSGDTLVGKQAEKNIIFWENKVAEYLKQRGYKDEVFLKSRSEALQRELEVEKQNHILLQNKYHELKQFNKELNKTKSQAKKITEDQAMAKNQFISILEADMDERQLLGNLKDDKYKREGQINQIAPSLIQKEELHHILEILYTHRVLGKIIRTKTNRLLATYEQVNRAYNHIKSNSNLLDPDKILKRMQEHDSIYDAALKRVSALQGQLVKLQGQMQSCLLNKNDILSRQGKDQTIKKGYYQGLERDNYELVVSQREKLRDRKREDGVLRKNIEAWGIRMFAEFGIQLTQHNTFLDCLTDLVVRMRQHK